ncbi:FixH family protein [Virgibacillus halophilus]|uniref:FixH family protein n=1 Tax=Tigheibacillus halophilus TaxID=361280 RepID=A0ABU5C1M0_9BACI|nr:FixH family protein [Virgibacillus halophilus]
MKRLWLVTIIFCLTAILAACSGQDGEKDMQSEQTPMLKVEFKLPDTAKIKEQIELKAIVTYGDEKVKDADDVTFEYWKKDEKDNSTKVASKNNKDGTYTANVSFDETGTYELYAHTTARDLHTMPKKSIDVADK